MTLMTNIKSRERVLAALFVNLHNYDFSTDESLHRIRG
jgi:hypothetical protein